MAIMSRAPTTIARRSVCVKGLATLSSTTLTALGRSVTDSKRLILIIEPQLLSKPDQQRWPFPEQLHAYNRDRNFSHPLVSDGRDQRPPQVSRSDVPSTPSTLLTSIRHPR